jgi:uncharacterized protein YegL
MGNELIIRQQDLVENPTARVPVCLVLDASGSMSGEPIKELNDGVKIFYNSVYEDEIARYSAEICIVTFGSTAKLELDFANIERQKVPRIKANGTTPMGSAVELALDLLEQRKQEYSDVGVDYYQPWMVLMTDGKPTDDIKSSVKRTRNLIEQHKLTIFPIGIGEYADMDILARFSPNRTPLRLKGLNFKDFFEWLSKSVTRVSHSMPGETIELDIDGIKGWSEI